MPAYSSWFCLLLTVATAPLLACPVTSANLPCQIKTPQGERRMPNGTARQYRQLSGFRSGSLELKNCQYYILENNHLQGDLRGIYIQNSQHIIIRHNRIENTQQEAIAIKPGSAQIQILHNRIHNTGLRGLRQVKAQDYAEGIYIGDGRNPAPVHQVLIQGNRISQTRAEAIEIKPQVTAVTIEQNYIHDGQASHGGAIAIGAYDPNPGPDPQHLIRHNVIENFRARADRKNGKQQPYTWVAGGIWLNAGAQVYGNHIANVHSCGILIPQHLSPRHQLKIDRNQALGNPLPLCQGYGQTKLKGNIQLGQTATNATDLGAIVRRVKANAG